ncbi:MULTISPECIES: ABC transporter permease [unclassified Achromobacter]|uniref:ABC transporter permease n=1 Tax=unclassified Achromobacter TaxID=2626865 RepID=UPI000B51778A|nr:MULTISPECIES: ABC transporter permease [unclassified Achromobacter]OWT73743.1 ABC transporter permease [Achromobacter sp. HZ34]OWT79341.1 ABC transporter permease [Achromobacter sp. HZ28]
MRAKLKLFARNRMAVFGAIVFLFMLFLTIASALLYPKGAFGLSGPPLQPPGDAFLLGTDSLGRDVAAGVAYGARASLMIGVLAALSAVVIGALVGAFAGYCRGNVDVALMRVTEFFQTIPAFLLAMLLVVILSPSVFSVIVAIAAVSWPGIARLVRGEFVALGGREFVLASTSLGASASRIIFRHLLPNCLSPIIAVGSLLVANAILLESGLSFLGLGDPNVMSWGLLISAGRTSLRTAWWVCTFPGIALLLTVLAINLVGDGLNEAFNPRLRDR